jgi:hypothetical protein
MLGLNVLPANKWDFTKHYYITQYEKPHKRNLGFGNTGKIIMQITAMNFLTASNMICRMSGSSGWRSCSVIWNFRFRNLAQKRTIIFCISFLSYSSRHMLAQYVKRDDYLFLRHPYQPSHPTCDSTCSTWHYVQPATAGAHAHSPAPLHSKSARARTWMNRVYAGTSRVNTVMQHAKPDGRPGLSLYI